MGKLSRAKPQHSNSPTSNSATRRRSMPTAESVKTNVEDAAYGKRGNAPSPRGKKRAR